MPALPLSTPLSQLLVAFTIEFDNELDHRLVEADVGRRLPISMVMWSNFMRFVGDGITVGELPDAAGIPKSRTLSTLGGMERWRYVFVSPRPTGPPPKSERDGWGSARALRREWFVRPTDIGRKTQEIAPPLFGELEGRWEQRFGTASLDELRQVLGTVIQGLEVELPEYLPIVDSRNGMLSEFEGRERGAADGGHLTARLARVLFAYTLDFERTSDVSLPLTANFLRILGDAGLDVRDVPAIAGVSPEATSMALRFLAKTGYATVEAKVARLTAKGLEAQAAALGLHASVERAWAARRLRKAVARVLDQRSAVSEGLRPYPDGWRARKRYVEQTNAVIADPTRRLPHYPMVLHRGGWPDGS
ncbi:MAG: hypothetical protein ABWY51_00900 [Gaiellaceae bacterium]